MLCGLLFVVSALSAFKQLFYVGLVRLPQQALSILITNKMLGGEIKEKNNPSEPAVLDL